MSAALDLLLMMPAVPPSTAAALDLLLVGFGFDPGGTTPPETPAPATWRPTMRPRRR
jgi:hypothetical protein